MQFSVQCKVASSAKHPAQLSTQSNLEPKTTQSQKQLSPKAT